MKSIFPILLFLCVLTTACEKNAPEEVTYITIGTAGALTWTLTSDGNLTIQGQGAMPDYKYEHYAPWYEYRGEIKTVTIEDGVTSIGSGAFYYCDTLYVPAGCVGAYKANWVWNNAFTYIVEQP